LPLAAYHMSQGGPELTIAPPVLGQHSRNILESAGLSAAEIDRLFAEGVVV
jgi:crotonobetainyl-CoA:carnitine CoA-transferase CaiB-like acyl-CoA transferase